MNKGVLTQAPIANQDLILRDPNILMVEAEPTEPPEKRFITVDEGQRITDKAAAFNVPYKWGGKNESGADCSGAVSLIYRKAGFPLTEKAGGENAKGFVNILELRSVSVTPKGTPKPQSSREYGGYDLEGAQKGDILRWAGHVAIYDPDCPDKMWSAKGDKDHEGTPFGRGQLSWHAKIRGTPIVLRYQVLQAKVASG